MGWREVRQFLCREEKAQIGSTDKGFREGSNEKLSIPAFSPFSTRYKQKINELLSLITLLFSHPRLLFPHICSRKSTWLSYPLVEGLFASPFCSRTEHSRVCSFPVEEAGGGVKVANSGVIEQPSNYVLEAILCDIRPTSATVEHFCK